MKIQTPIHISTLAKQLPGYEFEVSRPSHTQRPLHGFRRLARHVLEVGQPVFSDAEIRIAQRLYDELVKIDAGEGDGQNATR